MELLLCRYDTPRLSSEAKNYLSGLLAIGRNGGNAATSSYHGDDDDDHDDDDLDYDGGDESYVEEDDCSVVEAAVVQIRPVQEYSSDDDYGPYWDNALTSMPYLDHVSD